jgi:hypothetical protein
VIRAVAIYESSLPTDQLLMAQFCKAASELPGIALEIYRRHQEGLFQLRLCNEQGQFKIWAANDEPASMSLERVQFLSSYIPWHRKGSVVSPAPTTPFKGLGERLEELDYIDQHRCSSFPTMWSQIIERLEHEDNAGISSRRGVIQTRFVPPSEQIIMEARLGETVDLSPLYRQYLYVAGTGSTDPLYSRGPQDGICAPTANT